MEDATGPLLERFDMKHSFDELGAADLLGIRQNLILLWRNRFCGARYEYTGRSMYKIVVDRTV